MKTIFQLAHKELRTLFCSPIAWLILVIFAFQAGLTFCEVFGGQLKSQALGFGLYGVTAMTYDHYSGLLVSMLRNLYLYIPLITMGIMSREYSSGSIKFLYSSPITNTQIIIGKYISMVAFGLMLMGILMIYIIFGYFTIENMNLSFVMTGLFGLFLLTCAYAAIGLFMSSITSYQVFAAMGTLTILAVLNFIGGVGQDIAFVRDITYWLSISGRAYEFLRGMICSEDILYFVIVISLFLVLSIMRLQGERQKRKTLLTVLRYCSVIAIALMLGYISSLPSLKFYADTTETKSNTLTPGSREIVKQLKGGMTITTYTNLLEENYGNALPDQIKNDFKRFEQYIRFKPEIKMKYVYYYDTTANPSYAGQFMELSTKKRAERIAKILNLKFDRLLSPEEIRKEIDLRPEGNRFVRVIERSNGQKTILRMYNDISKHPTEKEITTALKRFLVKAPKIGFLTGHGERNIRSGGDRFYQTFAGSIYFRHSLINQGFDVEEVSLSSTSLPEDIDILVIADMRTPLSEKENERVKEYIARGGNLFILVEPNREDSMNPLLQLFGWELTPGILVQDNRGDFLPTLITGKLTADAAEISPRYRQLRQWQASVVMPTATGLTQVADMRYLTQTLVESLPHGSWNELETTDFLDGELSMNPNIGEKEGAQPLVIALTKQFGSHEQRIILSGDADCISNGELSANRSNIHAANFDFITESFKWLSHGEFPIETFRPEPTDSKINLPRKAIFSIQLFALGIIPGILLLIGMIISIRRKRR